MLMRKCLLAMLMLKLIILMLILMLLNWNTGYAGADTDLYAELSSKNNILFLAFTFINCNIMNTICIIFITVID